MQRLRRVQADEGLPGLVHDQGHGAGGHVVQCEGAVVRCQPGHLGGPGAEGEDTGAVLQVAQGERHVLRRSLLVRIGREEQATGPSLEQAQVHDGIGCGGTITQEAADIGVLGEELGVVGHARIAGLGGGGQFPGAVDKAALAHGFHHDGAASVAALPRGPELAFGRLREIR